MRLPTLPPVFASERARRRVAVHLALAILALVGLVVLVHDSWEVLFDRRAARDFVRSYGALAPLALVVLQALQVVVAPVPGQLLAAVAGYLFGPWLGTLYNMLGIALGSAAALWLSRLFGRAYVERVVHPDLLARWDGIDDRHAVAALFVLFLVPGLPDDALCFAGGLTTARLRTLVAAAVVGRTPGFFLVNVVGDRFGAGDVVSASLVLAGLLAVTGLAVLYRDRLEAALLGKG